MPGICLVAFQSRRLKESNRQGLLCGNKEEEEGSPSLFKCLGVKTAKVLAHFLRRVHTSAKETNSSTVFYLHLHHSSPPAPPKLSVRKLWQVLAQPAHKGICLCILKCYVCAYRTDFISFVNPRWDLGGVRPVAALLGVHSGIQGASKLCVCGWVGGWVCVCSCNCYIKYSFS